MDDINEKLNTLLSDPDSMARIMQLAQQLSGRQRRPANRRAVAVAAGCTCPACADVQHRPTAHRKVSAPHTGVFPGQQPDYPASLRPPSVFEGRKAGEGGAAAKLARLICIGKRFLTEGGGLLV